jgi:2-C-methyl-D-erythritol 4-phosphate cytidylyltransferase
MTRTAAVIVAAGAGERFAGDGPRKQFLPLGDHPILAWSCRAVRGALGDGRIVLVLPADIVDDPPGWLRDRADAVVAGGATRRESVALGLAAVPGETEVVVVHDGVRPFASAALIRRVADAAGEGPVVPVLPVVDTVKRVDGEGRVTETLDRSSLRRVQTPQGFPASVLRRVHARAEDLKGVATDDAALCEAAAVTVRTVAGEPHNLKVTTVQDLAYARWLLTSGRVPVEDRDAGR